MAGTVTVTEVDSGNVKQITFTWLSDASGNATATTADSYTGSATYAIFTPGAATPTTLYDVTLKDVGNVDILGGAGANLIVTGAVAKQASDGLTAIVTAGVLALSITNAGNAKNGVIVVWIQGVTNAYCSLQQVKNRIDPQGSTTIAADDTTILEMIDQSSRAIDTFCGGRTFYARTAETRYFDANGERQIDLDDDLLALTTLTNGDGNTVSATYYDLVDKNTLPYYAIRLKANSGVFWVPDSLGNYEYAVTVLGTWGYVDRSATDARSTRIIRATEHATIETVTAVYQSRFGENATFNTIVTPSGMVITPRDIPGWAQEYILAYRKKF